MEPTEQQNPLEPEIIEPVDLKVSQPDNPNDGFPITKLVGNIIAEVEAENDVGRPKITFQQVIEDWPRRPDYKGATDLETFTKDVLELYSEGASDVEIRGLIAKKSKNTSMSEDLWYRLLKEDKQFSLTVKVGRQLSQIWWEHMGRTKLKDKEFNYILWHMNMQNRFDWSNKAKIKHDGEINTGEAEALAAIADTLKELVTQDETTPESTGSSEEVS